MRKVLPTAEWDKVRKETYRHFNYTCGICGATDTKVECHEVWSYDDKKNIQSLDGLICLCGPCHRVKHYGHSQILASQGKLDLDKINQHFMKVNQCDYFALVEHIRASMQEWDRRSQHPWHVDLGPWNHYKK